MKRILPMLLLTVMLRVWWGDSIFSRAGNGIVVGSCGKAVPAFIVRTDNDDIVTVSASSIIKSKWVEVKAEK